MDERTRLTNLTRRITLATAIAGCSCTLSVASPSQAADPWSDRGISVSHTSSHHAGDHEAGAFADLVRSELSMVPMIRSRNTEKADPIDAPVRLEVAPRVHRIPLGGFQKQVNLQDGKPTAMRQAQRGIVQYVVPIETPRTEGEPSVSTTQEPISLFASPPVIKPPTTSDTKAASRTKPEPIGGSTEASDAHRTEQQPIPAPPTRLVHAQQRASGISAKKATVPATAAATNQAAEAAQVRLLPPVAQPPIQTGSKRIADRRVSDLLQFDLLKMLRR